MRPLTGISTHSIYGVLERPKQMNRYAKTARNHWQTWRPAAFAELDNPQEYFNRLGEEIEQQIQGVTFSGQMTERSSLSGLSDLERIGRLNAIRKSAEEQVLHEMVWDHTETPTEDSEPEPDLDLASQQEEELVLAEAVIEDGMLLPTDRQHPLWTLAAQDPRLTSTQRVELEQLHETWLEQRRHLLVWLETPALQQILRAQPQQSTGTREAPGE